MNKQIMSEAHTFHIPVMGIGYTIDTPIKIAHLGIDSVISLVDDILLEKLRKMYCDKYGLPYKEINKSVTDHRAERITAYLNMVEDLRNKNFNDLLEANADDGKTMMDYINLLPDHSRIRQSFDKLRSEGRSIKDILLEISPMLQKGSIDVNIMTKVDKTNYHNGEQLPRHHNDAHAALRGFANSKLNSSVVLSAGMNPSLYAYLENFTDFFPDADNQLKKKVILKVSDYKSALIQGKYLAKKGIWVSEYRVESGLNCGGHAFATNGLLMGPILEEFKNNKQELIQSVHEVLITSLKNKEKQYPDKPLPLKLSVQGGVGLATEHIFLLDYYGFDSVGWGSPFLLVPEATTVDDDTIKKLQSAKEEDLYLSNISPLGVPFNSLRGNTKDIEKEDDIALGRPGSNCPKKYVALNHEFTTRGICSASRLYQRSKLKQLEDEKLSADEKEVKYKNIIEKSCICVGLGTSALIKYGMDTSTEGKGVSVCPGPNMAYYNEIASLRQMTDHIYGRSSLKMDQSRPHMFLKELKLYFDYLHNKINNTSIPINIKQYKLFILFTENLLEGIEYYKQLFTKPGLDWGSDKTTIVKQLNNFSKTIQLLNNKIESLERLDPVSV